MNLKAKTIANLQNRKNSIIEKMAEQKFNTTSAIKIKNIINKQLTKINFINNQIREIKQ